MVFNGHFLFSMILITQMVFTGTYAPQCPSWSLVNSSCSLWNLTDSNRPVFRNLNSPLHLSIACNGAHRTSVAFYDAQRNICGL